MAFELPPLPDGFALDSKAAAPAGGLPPLPSGFELDGQPTPTKVDADGESSNLTRGFMGGLVGTNPAMFGNAAEAIGVMTGSTDLVDIGKQVQQFGAGQLEKYRPDVPSIRNIRTDNVANFIDDTLSYGGYQLGQGVASTIPSLTAGAGVGLLTANPIVGAVAGAAGPSYLQNLGDVYSGLKQELAKQIEAGEIAPEDVARTAMLAAVPMAALDMIGVGKLLGTFKGGKDALKRGLVTRMARAAASGATVEGITEGLQEVISQWTQASASGSDFATWDRFYAIVDNAVAGGLAGGGIGAGGGAVGGNGGQTSAKRPPTREVSRETEKSTAKGREVPAPPPGFEIDPDTGIAVGPAAGPQEGQENFRPVGAETPEATTAPSEAETEAVDQAAAQVDQTPSDAQKEAGNYRKGHVKIQGLDVTIETPQGGERTGTAPDGEPWSVTMPAHYGYVKRTNGADGEQVDVYIGDNPASEQVYVVDQVDPGTGKFDEHKAIVGADSQAEAEAIYDAGFSDGRGPERRGAVTRMHISQFKDWLANGNTKQPLAETWASPETFKIKSVETSAPGSSAAPVERGTEAPAPGQRPSGEAGASTIDDTGWENHVDRAEAYVRKRMEERRFGKITPRVLARDLDIGEGQAQRIVANLAAQGRGLTPAGYVQKPTERYDLFKAIRAMGGIRASDETRYRDLHKVAPGLVSRNGKDADELALRLWEDKFFPGEDRPSVNDFWALVDRQIHNGPVMPIGETDQTAIDRQLEEEQAQLADARRELDEYLAEYGPVVAPEDKEAVAIDMMTRRVDAETASEDYMDRVTRAYQGGDWGLLEKPVEKADTAPVEEVPFDDTANDTGREATGREGPDVALEEAGPVREGEDASEEPGESAPRGRESTGEPGQGLTTEQTPQGEQTVIPGAERISDRELVERRMEGPSRTAVQQKGPPEGGLFDEDARNQTDLEDFLGPEDKAALGPRFNPDFIAQRDQVVAKLKQILRTVAPNAKLRVVDTIWRDAGKTEQVRGTFDWVRNLVTVSLGYGDPVNTLRHEVVHALKAMGLFTDAEWAVLEREARRNWRSRYGVDERYAGLVSTQEDMDEEAIADAFADWRSGKQFAPGFRKIFARIELFLKRLGNALRGLGFQAAEDVFEYIEAGEIGTRGPDGKPLTVRSAWGGFPNVVIQRGLGFAKNDPDYAAAKAGDDDAAFRIAERAVDAEKVMAIRDAIGDSNPIIVPVAAEERTGTNQLPRAYAGLIGEALGLEFDENIVQTNKVQRTGKGAWHRLAFQPVFDGPVQAGRDYVIVDDTVTMGGTLAALRGYIESNGGKVILATTLTGQGRSAQIAASPDQVRTLRKKHGAGLEYWWKQEFGHGFDALTEAEARNLIQVGSADGVRNRIAAAKEQGIEPQVPRTGQGQREDTGDQGETGRKFAVSQADESLLESMRGRIGADQPSLWQKLRALLIDRPLERMKQALFDDLHALKLLEMASNDGKLYEDARSAYKLARLSRGINDVIFDSMYYGAPVWREGTTAIDTSVRAPMQIINELGDRLGDFELYIAGRRADELRQPTEEFPEGRENLFPDEEIDAALRLVESNPDFAGLFDELQTYNGRLLDFAQQSGLLSEETRAFFDEMHRNYVPFFRIMEGGDTKAPRAKLGFAGQHPNFYKLTGGTANIDHPLLNLERNVHRLIEASVKNVVMLRTAQLNAELGHIFMDPMGRTVRQAAVTNAQMLRDLEKQGIEITDEDNVNPDAVRILWSLGNAPKGDSIVSMVRGGKVEFYDVTDPMLFRSLTMVHRTQIPFIGPLRMAKHLLTAAVGLDPSFQIANFLRDTMHASVISHVGFKPVFGSLRGFKGRLMKDADWRTFLQSGAGMSSLFEADRPTMHRVVEKRIRKGRGPLGRIVDGRRSFIGMLEHMESTFEYSTRVGAFKRLRDQGVPLIEAAYQAREISTDFAMRGDWVVMRLLAETVPFLNAGVQGLYRTGRGATENPVAFAVKGSIVAAASIALYLFNRDDERYRELSPYQRDTYWHFWIGGQHWKIPKPFEVGAIFGSIPERMVEAAVDKERQGEFLDRLQWIFTQMFRLSVVPQLAQPPMRVYANWDEFRERPVVPPELERVQPEEQYDTTTPLSAIEAGRLSGQSPKKIETLVNGYLGAWGGYLMAASDAALRTISNYPEAPATYLPEYPVLRRLMGRDVPRSTYYTNQFYEMKREVDATWASIQKLLADGETERARKMLREHRGAVAVRDSLNKIAKQLAKINKTIRIIRNNRTMSAEEKRRREDELQLVKNRLTRAAAKLKPLYEKRTT